MRFNEEKKKSIIVYLLEKIDQQDEGISKAVSDAFSINQNTAHTYINELVEDGAFAQTDPFCIMPLIGKITSLDTRRAPSVSILMF